MSDLINDLHDMADALSAEEYSEDAERIRDAIDEIERLRAVIAASHQSQPLDAGDPDRLATPTDPTSHHNGGSP